MGLAEIFVDLGIMWIELERLQIVLDSFVQLSHVSCRVSAIVECLGCIGVFHQVEDFQRLIMVLGLCRGVSVVCQVVVRKRAGMLLLATFWSRSCRLRLSGRSACPRGCYPRRAPCLRPRGKRPIPTWRLSNRPNLMSNLMVTSFSRASKIHDQDTAEIIPAKQHCAGPGNGLAPYFR